MSAIIQDNRPVKIYSQLEDNVLIFCSLSGVERLSQLFSYSVEVASEDLAIDLNSLTGTDITVELELPLGGYRYYHGFVSNCSHIESAQEYARYQLVIRPWAWFLTRTADCKIFQKMSIPDIIKKVFDEEGLTDYIDSLTGRYDQRDYCVQYRETDFNFVSRLMEQEGIYYYFKHEYGTHKLVLSDSLSAHEVSKNYEEVPYYPTSSGQIRERDHLSCWQINQNLQPGGYATSDFNFEDPRSDLLVKKEAPGSHAKSDYEIYDYPGEYENRATGENVANLRMEELQAPQNILMGSGTSEGLSAGHLFTLTNAHQQSQNREYLILESHSQFQRENFGRNGSNDTDFYCQINAIPSDQPFRAPRLTPKPIVQGPQTAIVVGPAGKEIWTDEHGRVKLQFHWDRYGNSDENSSCWVRVSQVHAGAGFGGIDIPRIDEEVIVEYLDGDPDRPIVTGRVYNGDNMPPTGLPAAGMVSGLKSNSTPGGGGYNEMTMDDTKGQEKIAIHGQFNMDTTVENDQSITLVSGNRTVTVESGTQTETIKGNASLTVQAGTRIVDVTGGNYSATSSHAIILHGKSLGVGITGDTEGVGITGNGKGVAITGNGGGVGITGNSEGVGITGNGKGVGITGNGEGVGIIGTPGVYVEGDSNITLEAPTVDIGDQEINITGTKIVISAAGGSITIDAAGVTIQGSLVKIN